MNPHAHAHAHSHHDHHDHHDHHGHTHAHTAAPPREATPQAAPAEGGAGLLILSVALLAIGPIIFRLTSRSARALAFLDGFILTSIAGLLLAHVLPEAMRIAGPLAILFLAIGAMLPMLFERLSATMRTRANSLLWALALAGFVLHTMLDGVALVHSAQDAHRHALAAAVILHRLPVGIAIWWLVRPRYGKRWAILFLAIEAFVTLIGYQLGPDLLRYLEDSSLALFQATVAGSLLHVLAHHSPKPEELDPYYPKPHEVIAQQLTSNTLAFQPLVPTSLKLAPVAPNKLRLLPPPPKPATEPSCGDDDCGACAPEPDAHACCDHNHASSSTKHPGAETLGAALGLLIVFLLPLLEPHDHDHDLNALAGWTERFLHLALESAPALLLGYTLAGLATVYLPRFSMQWLSGKRGGSLQQAARGVIFGAPIPLCSCGVVPLYQALIRRGAPPSAAMAFLVATPELGVESILLSLPLLGVKLTAARLIAALAVALLVGWLLGRTIAPHAPNFSDEAAPRDETTGQKLKRAMRFGFRDVVDDSAAWILIGLLAASALAANALPPWLQGLPPSLSILAFATLGMPLYVCASGATPLAAALIFAGASPGAAVAFLIAGPATNVTTLGVLRKMHGRGTGLRFGAVVVGLACVAGIITDKLIGNFEPIPMHAHGHEVFNPLHWLSLALVTAAFASSIWRHGPRNMVRTLTEGDAHGHNHG